jgi:hypothetical protein
VVHRKGGRCAAAWPGRCWPPPAQCRPWRSPPFAPIVKGSSPFSINHYTRTLYVFCLGGLSWRHFAPELSYVDHSSNQNFIQLKQGRPVKKKNMENGTNLMTLASNDSTAVLPTHGI